MRTFAALCLSAILGVFSFIPTIISKEKHAWKSSPHLVKPILSVPPSTRTAEEFASMRRNALVAAAYAATKAAAAQTTSWEYAAWSRVSVCENGPGAWNPPKGSAYPDSLGISAVNWYGNGGGSDLSPAAQIHVAEKIQMNPPDQNGCAPW